MHLAAAAGLTPHAAHGQDAALLAADHAGQRQLAQVECTAQVHVQHPLPLLRGDVGKQLLLRDAGVAHQYIHPAHGLLHCMERQLTAGAAGYIALDGDAPGQLLLQRSGGSGVLVVEHRHLIPCCRKGAGSGSTDAPVAAGDQHPARRSGCGRGRPFFYRLRRRRFGLRRRRRLCRLFQRDHPGGLLRHRCCRFFQRHDACGFIHHRHRRLCSRYGKGLRRALFLRHLKGQFKLVLVQECIPPVRYSRLGVSAPSRKNPVPIPRQCSVPFVCPAKVRCFGVPACTYDGFRQDSIE